MILYHYTCRDQLRGIKALGAIRPHRHPLLPDAPPIIWLTDLAVPEPSWLGLTSQMLACDRTEYRIAVDSGNTTARHWPVAAHLWRLPREQRGLLESGDAKPMHWWAGLAAVEIKDVVISATGEPDALSQ